MLTCQGCMRNCLQTLIGDSLIVSRPGSSTTLSRPFRRTYYASTPKTNADSSGVREGYGTGYGYKDRQAAAREKESKPAQRQKWMESRGIRPPDKSKSRSDDGFVVRKHLEYLKDPLKLADFVRSTLRSGDFETAQEVVRAASKNVQCTVSWNHLIGYQLEKHKMTAAFKTYNEMKKRAQHPDAYTYTIIFRGLTDYPHPDIALEKCMAVYQTMQNEKSLVKPNTIHMNALLKMCARANNLDAMFAIAGSFDRKGMSAPNNLTFTTILNALRMSALIDSRSELSPMQKRENTRNAIAEARRTWARLVKLWRKGEIWIDEELVASMGRILLNGNVLDADDILSLVEQAMNIPRQIAPRVRVPEEDLEAKAQIEAGKEAVDEHITLETGETATSTAVEMQDSLDLEELIPSNLFAPKITTGTPSPPIPKGSTAYALPGQNILSVLMSACLAIKSKEAASSYWNILTTQCTPPVRPDPENYHAYLRILRVFRSSSEAISVLLNMKPSDLQHKTFRIAMSTCERDKLNRNAFANAGKILDLMSQQHSTQFREESISVLISYLQIAISSPALAQQADGRWEPSKHAQGRQIVRALDRLEPFMKLMRTTFLITNPGLENKAPLERAQLNADFVLLVRRMIGACDELLFKGLVTKEMGKDVTAHRSRLAAFLNRPRFTKTGTVHASPLVPAAWEADEGPESAAIETETSSFKAVEDKTSVPTWGAGTQKSTIPQRGEANRRGERSSRNDYA